MSPGQAADGTADRRAAQSGHDGTGRNEGAEPGNRQRPDAGQPAQGASQNGTGPGTRCGAFRSLGIVLVCKLLRPALVGHQDGNVVARKTSRLQIADDGVGLRCVRSAKNGFRHDLFCESSVKVVENWLGLVRPVAVQGILFSQHFGDDENDDRPKDTSAGQQVHERIPGSR